MIRLTCLICFSHTGLEASLSIRAQPESRSLKTWYGREILKKLWDYDDINIVSEDRINRIYTNWPPDKPNNPKWQRESRQLLVQGAG